MNSSDKKQCSMLCPLQTIYGRDEGKRLYLWILNQIERFREKNRLDTRSDLDESDAILITYPDQFKRSGEPPLKTLRRFCLDYLKNVFNIIHLLPFYPWSSDDGFAVIDYLKVKTEYGSWDDIDELSRHFYLMFDAVINHVSSQNTWFRSFLRGDPDFRDYFLTSDDISDLSKVVRPRKTPLLTEFNTDSGVVKVWTTFGPDQIDLSYKNPEVLKEVINLLLFYVSHGCRFIRLDAIAYLWKESGTGCIHLPQTHAIIQIFNEILRECAPHVKLITETNVPHEDNVSYFSDAGNEAHLVYNFALPPLIMHTILKEDARALTEWAAKLTLPSKKVSFFNFLASHDGIGLNPARGILSVDEIDVLVNKTLEHQGLVSYKSNEDGTQSPYELNISYFDALSNPLLNESVHVQVMRFLAAHAIMLSLVGLPGIYIHSLLGSRSWHEGVEKTGHARTINRQKFTLDHIESQLSDQESIPSQVYQGMSHLLVKKKTSSAFHPHGAQLVMDFGRSIFALMRISPDGEDFALCLHNISSSSQKFVVDPVLYGLPAGVWRDLLTDQQFELEPGNEIALEGYQTAWLIM